MRKLRYLFIILFIVLLSASISYAVVTEGTKTLKRMGFEDNDDTWTDTRGADYNSWYAFWNDIGDLTGDLTLQVEATKFYEINSPPTFDHALGDYTLTIEPLNDYSIVSSDGKTGPQIIARWSSGTEEILDLQPTGTGTVVITGMSFSTPGTLIPAYIFNVGNDNASTTIIKNCSISGNKTTPGSGIYVATSTAKVQIYNNYIYECNDGIILASNLIDGSHISNNVVYDCGDDGIVVSLFDCLLKNNISWGNDTEDFDINTNPALLDARGYYNISSDASASDSSWKMGSNNQINISTDIFTDSANNEFSIASTETNVVDQGGAPVLLDDAESIYRFENNALVDDAQDNNTPLVAINSPANASGYQEGANAVAFDNNDGYYITNTNLSADFPGTQSNNDVTVCAWYRPGTDSASAYAGIASMWDGTDSKKIWLFGKNTSDIIYFQKGYNSGASQDTSTHDQALAADDTTWYWACASYDDATRQTYIIVRDVAGSTTGTDVDETQTNPMDVEVTDDPEFAVNGWRNAGAAAGGKESTIDSLFIYNKALTVKEMEQLQTSYPLDHRVAQYRFESGYLTTDETDNGNSLTNIFGSPETLYDPREGHSAVSLGWNDHYSSSIASLSDDFPGKGTGDLTVSLDYKPNAGSGGNYHIISMYAAGGAEDGRRWAIRKDNTDKIKFHKGYNNGTQEETTILNYALDYVDKPWYGVDVTYDESGRLGTEGAVRIRLWDYSASAYVVSDMTATHSNTMALSTDYTPDFQINIQRWASSNNEHPCEIDNIRIYNIALSVDELDREHALIRDSYGRSRDFSPDVGAFEYIPSKTYYIKDTDGDNSYSGEGYGSAWADFTNLNNRTLNPGDTVKLAMNDTWSDNLWIVGMGVSGDHVSVTNHDPGDGVANPLIYGASGRGIEFRNSYRTDVNYIDVQRSSGVGIRIENVSQVTLADILQSEAALTANNTNHISGISLSYFDDVAIDACTGNWNHGHGITFKLGDNLEVTNSTFNYNGIVHQDVVWVRGVNAETASWADQLGTNLNFRNCDISYNSLTGVVLPPYSIFENNTVTGNGDGWPNQQVLAFRGGMAEGDTCFPDGTTVTQAVTGKSGAVHHCESSTHIRDGSTGWLTVHATTSTGWDQNNLSYGGDTWIPFIGTTHPVDFTDEISGAGGGGVDGRFTDDTIVRYNEVSDTVINENHTGDGFGINADNFADGMLIYGNIVHGNGGPGLEANDSGHDEANIFYHNLAYNNAISDRNDRGGIYTSSTVERVVFINNISLDDDELGIRITNSPSYPSGSGIILANNFYYRSPGGVTNVAKWMTTAARDHTEMASWVSDSGDENSQFVDPLLVDVSTDDFRLKSSSTCIDAGLDMTSTTEGLDFYGNTVPVDGDAAGGAQSDIGHHEYSIGFKWGDTPDVAKYHNDGWIESDWDNHGSTATVDTDTGDLTLPDDQRFISPVKDLGSGTAKSLSISHNETSGSGTICWRGQSTSFDQDATNPSWTAYSAIENKTWRYIQIGVVNKVASCSGLP
jgi:hypothetical protein